MQKLQRHCSLALQLLRSVRTTSSTAKIHLFLLPSRGKSGSKSTLSGSRKGDEICWQGSTSTKISCTKLSQVEFWSQNFGSKCHDWSKSLLLGNFIFWISPLFHFGKYSNNAYCTNKKVQHLPACCVMKISGPQLTQYKRKQFLWKGGNWP